MTNPPKQQIKIELGEKEAEGIYANMALLMHSPTEIILDFARVMPRAPKARVLARIIMTPMHAKLLQKTLEDNLNKFEKQFGPIKVHGELHQAANTIGFENSPDSPGEQK